MLIKQKGMGLVETLITLLIIAAGVVALIQFQNSLVYSDDFAKQKSDATILAANKLESLRDLNLSAYSTIANGSSTSTGSNATYTITWTVTASSFSPQYNTISVTTSWTDRRGATQSVNLVSNVANLDPGFSAGVM